MNYILLDFKVISKHRSKVMMFRPGNNGPKVFVTLLELVVDLKTKTTTITKHVKKIIIIKYNLKIYGKIHD